MWAYGQRRLPGHNSKDYSTVYSLWFFYIIYLIDFPFKEMSLLFLFGKINDIAYAISLPLTAIMCVAWTRIRKWDNLYCEERM